MRKIKVNKKKILALDENGNVQYDSEGFAITICEYGNCKHTAKQGYIKCEKHLGVKQDNLARHDFHSRLLAWYESMEEK